MMRTTFYKAYSHSHGYGYRYEPFDDGVSCVNLLESNKGTNCKRTSARGGLHIYASDNFQLSQMRSKHDLCQGKKFIENALELLFSTEFPLISNH